MCDTLRPTSTQRRCTRKTRPAEQELGPRHVAGTVEAAIDPSSLVYRLASVLSDLEGLSTTRTAVYLDVLAAMVRTRLSAKRASPWSPSSLRERALSRLRRLITSLYARRRIRSSLGITRLKDPPVSSSGAISRFRYQTLGAEGAIAQARFEDVVNRYYHPLYQFALGLTHNASEAADMTQQAFYLWATKGHQLRDDSKVKTWLFTTLHREFLRVGRQERRFPHHELEEVYPELPLVEPLMADHLDAMSALQALARLPEPYQAPVTLFYLWEYSYKEIADILEVPVGTVQSRIARGKTKLQRLVNTPAPRLAERDRECCG